MIRKGHEMQYSYNDELLIKKCEKLMRDTRSEINNDTHFETLERYAELANAYADELREMFERYMIGTPEFKLIRSTLVSMENLPGRIAKEIESFVNAAESDIEHTKTIIEDIYKTINGNLGVKNSLLDTAEFRVMVLENYLHDPEIAEKVWEQLQDVLDDLYNAIEDLKEYNEDYEDEMSLFDDEFVEISNEESVESEIIEQTSKEADTKESEIAETTEETLKAKPIETTPGHDAGHIMRLQGTLKKRGGKTKAKGKLTPAGYIKLPP